MTNYGPARWMRAAQNAALHPNSHGGRLYRARVVNATLVATKLSQGPFAHMRSAWDSPGRYKARHYTCGGFCAGMQAQLDCATTDDSARLAAYLTGDTTPRTITNGGWSFVQRNPDFAVPVTPGMMTRRARCVVCGTGITPV